MKPSDAVRTNWTVLVLGIMLPLASSLGAAPPPPTRNADEDVKSPGLRQKSGLLPRSNLLFNGWGLTPAGESVPLSDLAVKFVISPDKKLLLNHAFASSAASSSVGRIT